MLALAKHTYKLLTINIFPLSTLEDASSVEVKCMESENADKPYLTGKFVIASLERTDAVQDDATYSISLENDSEVTFDETAYRGEWERVRRLAAISIQPHVKKTATPKKLLQFPWDDTRKERKDSRPRPTAEEGRKRFEEMVGHLGNKLD